MGEFGRGRLMLVVFIDYEVCGCFLLLIFVAWHTKKPKKAGSTGEFEINQMQSYHDSGLHQIIKPIKF